MHPLAADVAAGGAEQLQRFRVIADASPGLVWTSDAGVRDLQPARGFMQRVENLFFKLLPVSYY